ncbi:Rv3654c family TadE-like protein [Microbacterium sp. GXF7504]
MAGTVTAVAAVAAGLVLTAGLAAVGGAAAGAQRLTGAADAAALAAADAASGAVPGIPCTRAAEVAAAGGAGLRDCILEGATATVTVEARVLRWRIAATSRAGPPPSP